MLNDLARLAERSVMDMHDTIQQIYSLPTEDAQARVLDLMSQFQPDFRMLTPQGTWLSYGQVKRLFKSQAGIQPALRIEVSQCETLAIEGSLVAVRYRKTHSVPGETFQRVSVAMIDVSTRPARWRYLQERSLSA
ncbi:hypothetical protein CYR40_09450 [Chimaeribacter arupi]|jgi:hypothetical protein|uniref:DUF4440 domain-containing protein n=2 Tax=Yersiniaceae TaxID=1903411 RepID=A0A2N5EKL7_9GAMM|nr:MULTISPECIES: hypothetical protein [Yersiniaceae]MBS0968512.1 hypothetical protein [Nissabacter archeti]MDV5139865.1 hypothetical protein [Chimaeribacter arupi]PLR30473.1 hypothetical protein CYR23_17855 [Chimaeribacter arupi]PLR46909.1 hypothetical protein CYR40_09450 [Chimaeribacter arupi]PLR47065.1 hypothetical protein CYR34_15100 [Chimaeribacter arupi]